MIILSHPGQISVGYVPIGISHLMLLASLLSQRGLVVFLEEVRRWSQIREIVYIIPGEPMCVESFFDYSSLGSFAVCDMRWKIVEIIHMHARIYRER